MRLSQHTPVGRAFAERLDISSVPTLVVFDEMGTEQMRSIGSIPSPQEVAAGLQQE